MTPNSPPAWLKALGRNADLPTTIQVRNLEYRHIQTFKHDFFAATGLYECGGHRVVLKIGRRAPLWGISLKWIGRLLCRHEARLFQTVGSVDGIPAFLGYCGDTGLIHDYVPGRPLGKHDVPGDDFFPRLSVLLDHVHAQDAAYVDLEKRENVLLGEDGKPHLIDFQISWHWPVNRGGGTSLARFVLTVLQQSDRYHLLKHWRRMRPDQLPSAAFAASYSPPFWIRWHRAVFRPLTLLRRRILVWLGGRPSAHGRSPG